MAKVKQLQLNNEDIYPVTHESAVMDDNGTNLTIKLENSFAKKSDVYSQVESHIDDCKNVIAQLVLEELQGLPVFGIVDVNNTITITNQLQGGTYTLKYEDENGNAYKVGTIVIEGGKVVIVNLLESALDPSNFTSVFNGIGYMNGKYASAAEPFYGTDANTFCTGAMEIPESCVVYIKGVKFDHTNSHTRLSGFSETYANNNSSDFNTMSYFGTLTLLGVDYYSLTFVKSYVTAHNMKYFMFSTVGTGDNVIVSATPIEEPTIKELFVASTCILNKRLNSSGAETDQNGTFVTDYIDIGDLAPSATRDILFSGFQIQMNRASSPYTKIDVYDSSKTRIGLVESQQSSNAIEYDTSGIKTFKATVINPSTSKTARYIRITGHLGEDYATQGTTALTSTDQLKNCSLILKPEV